MYGSVKYGRKSVWVWGTYGVSLNGVICGGVLPKGICVGGCLAGCIVMDDIGAWMISGAVNEVGLRAWGGGVVIGTV